MTDPTKNQDYLLEKEFLNESIKGSFLNPF